jgi:butyryl-CoA dehydrogenase
MWISNGEHEITENIVHLVLAKIPDDDGKPFPARAASRSSSCRRSSSARTARSPASATTSRWPASTTSSATAAFPNTLLNFGEGKFPARGASGAIGYLSGQPRPGLRCMFHMMNEARIAVGLGATMLGFAGYEASLDYAKTRPQGRPIGPAARTRAKPQVRIIEHADVKRMRARAEELLRRRPRARASLRQARRRAAHR